ncbi:LacI family DNA-binding transcriptional regulator [Allorhizobium pseudoryzae]|uniref:LacI family DNA-binding transcriptional regulator n=1 Tax=Allorhizobium pseudoryzae TaxID=379684 RepID=UPI003CFDC329
MFPALMPEIVVSHFNSRFPFPVDMATKKQPTMNDVALLAGVTPMTVSRALRGTGGVSKDTRDRIERAADQLGYVVDSTAAGLSSRKSGFVAVVVPTINNSNFADTVRGITDGLDGTRLQILLGYTDYRADKEESIIRSLLARRPEAIIVTDDTHTEQSQRLLAGAGIPVIEMWGLPKEPIHRVVGFSNFKAAEAVTLHLYESGYRNIAFIGGSENFDKRGLERRRGYDSAVRQSGLGEPKVITYGVAPVSIEQGAHAMHQLLEVWPGVDAVVCVSDLLAFGALTQCQRQGIPVPAQMAIAGFGNYDISAYSVPPITTVDVHAYEIGRTVAQVVRKSIGNDEVIRSSEISITQFDIVKRASS